MFLTNSKREYIKLYRYDNDLFSHLKQGHIQMGCESIDHPQCLFKKKSDLMK